MKKLNNEFIKNNWIALVLIFLLHMNELGHLTFKGFYFKDKVLPCGHYKTIMLNTPIYYFTLAVRNVATSVFLFLLISKDKKSSRALIAGIIGWNLIELYQEYCYLAQIDENVFSFKGVYGQLALIWFIIFLVYFGSKKSKS